MISPAIEGSKEIPNWELLVSGIRNKDGAAFENFYQIFGESVRAHAMRQVRDGDIAANCASQSLMVALEGIERGSLRDPSRMAGYVWAIARNVVRKAIAGIMADRVRHSGHEVELLPTVIHSPEDTAILVQQKRNVKRALAAMRPMDREILRRFYFEDVPVAKIRRDLGITSTQFRVMKSRAKATLIQKVRDTETPPSGRPAGRARLAAVTPIRGLTAIRSRSGGQSSRDLISAA